MRMSKTVKVITTLILMVMLVMTFNSVAFAGGSSASSSGDISGVLQDIGTNASGQVAAGDVSKLGGQIVGIIQVVGIVIAVVILLVLGIKYMTGSAQEKAEYKKTMIPYIIGAILIFAASTIVNVIFNLATSINVG